MGGAERLLCPAAGEFLAHAAGAAPHRRRLHPSLADLPQRQLAADACVVKLGQDAMGGLGRGGVAEAVRAAQPPVPVAARVGLRVAGAENHGSVHVTPLVVDPQIQLQIGPIIGEGADDPLEGLCKGHRVLR
jgi:hypothetical protein